MAKIKGVCHNYDGCDKAAGKIVQEAEKSNFVCEECGKPLYPIKKGPKPAGDGKRIATLIAIFGGAALVIGGIVYGIVFGVQKSRENAEAERIEIARQDSIRAAEAAEQARRDSIKALEEAAETARLAEEAAAAAEQAAAEQARLDSIKAAEEAAKSVKKVSKGSLDYGKWSGAWKNGQPNGTGTMTYTKEHLIDSRDPKKRVAQPGDYIIGEFSNGRLVQGKWFDASNNVKGSIIIGK